MTPSKIWLSSPHMGGAEQSFIKEAFDTNWIAPLGPHVDGFEADLAAYTGTAHAAALSSGTAALHLAMILLDVQPGDYVLCQSMTFSASANPIVYQGATPVFIDGEADTWNMDPGVLETAIKDLVKQGKGKKIKAIVPVHLYGMPARMLEIQSIAERYGIPIIEDAAEALGSTYQGKPCGSMGTFGILSFNGNKIITTSSGGALLGNDAVLIEKARFLSTQARDPAPHYQHSHIGYNYRLSNVLAGIGRGQMQVLPERIAQRQANFDRYNDFFTSCRSKGFNIRFQEGLPNMSSNRWLTCILLDPASNRGITREKMRLAMEAQNIDARPLWKPMHLQPVFSGAPYYGGKISEYLFDWGLCLPSGSNLSLLDFERIFEVLSKLFAAN